MVGFTTEMVGPDGIQSPRYQFSFHTGFVLVIDPVTM